MDRAALEVQGMEAMVALVGQEVSEGDRPSVAALPSPSTDPSSEARKLLFEMYTSKSASRKLKNSFLASRMLF